MQTSVSSFLYSAFPVIYQPPVFYSQATCVHVSGLSYSFSHRLTDLDSSDENLLLDRHFDELGSLSVNGGEVLRWNGASLVNRLSNHIHNATERLGSNGDFDWISSVGDRLASHQTLSTVHGNAADHIISQMLRDFENESRGAANHLQTVQNGGQTLVELHVHDGSDYCHDAALRRGCRVLA